MRVVFGHAVFIIAQTRYGGMRVTGTPTKRVYTILNKGGWVHVDDEQDVLSREKHTACCGVVKPFAHGNPSANEVKRLPPWAYEPRVPEVLKRTSTRAYRPRRKRKTRKE